MAADPEEGIYKDVSDRQGDDTLHSSSGEGDSENEEEPTTPSLVEKIAQIYKSNEFVVLIVTAILLARAYPPIGATYLYPEITATWLAVVFIFVMAGLGLKTEELSNALQQVSFNLFVQLFNFGVVSVGVYGFSRFLKNFGILSDSLADGMVVCASLPLTINMVCVLTKAADGDEAAAIFNAAFGNMMGVFLSPILILTYLGVTGDVDLFNVFFKLCLRVFVPVVIGQILQKTSTTVVDFVKENKKHFKTIQQYLLVFIVYTVFCRTFTSESQASLDDIFLMIAFQFVLLISFMLLAWVLLGFFFKSQPRLRVMGLFGCTHKTVAMGIPLINAIYEGDSNVGLYTLPLLIWHPMQLLVGSYFTPYLVKFVEAEEARAMKKDQHGSSAEQADRSSSDEKAEENAEEAFP